VNDGQFIAEVKNLAELESDEDVRKAIGAALETLRERLAGEEPSDLATQLGGVYGELFGQPGASA
jgi:uncharacterized protein (DUF2267 family)